MELLSSRFFVILITYAFVPLFGFAWYIKTKTTQSVTNHTLFNALIFYGVICIIFDINFISRGQEYWNEMFYYNSGILFWLSLVITPFSAKQVKSLFFKEKAVTTPTHILHFIIGYLITYFGFLIMSTFFLELNNTIQTLNNLPK